VRPVFPSAYLGGASYSEASSFRIEENSDPAAAAIVVPDKVPPPPPAGPRVMSARPEPGRNYTVRSGDFLSRIAVRAYGTVSGITLIIAENNIRNPNLIYVGQVLYIPVYKE
jgi:nucleoid-associated protein YgaU